MNLDFTVVNWLAVAVAAMAAFFIGGAWYGAIFAKAWVCAHGFKEDELKVMQKQQMRNFGVFILSHLLLALVMSLLITQMGITSAAQGAIFSVLLWLGFSATQCASKNAAYSKSITAFCIDTFHELICFVTIGAIIGGWH